MTRLGWGLWIIFNILLIAISFGALEGLAIRTGTPTLSQTVWDATDAFSLLPFLVGLMSGLFCGGLGVHFFWRNKMRDDNDAMVSLVAKDELYRQMLSQKAGKKRQ